jgi:hypothetical protein
MLTPVDGRHLSVGDDGVIPYVRMLRLQAR